MNGPSADVALLVPSLSGGGQSKAQANLALGLANRGYRVDFLFFRAPGPYPDHVPTAARIVDLRTERGWRRLWFFLIANPGSFVLLLWHVLVTRRLLARPDHGGSRLWLMECLPALVRYLRHRRPAVVFAAGDRANLLAVCARRIASGETRVVVCQHNIMSQHLQEYAERTGPRRARLALGLMRRAFLQAGAIVAVSEPVREDLQRTAGIPSERVVTISNPVVTRELRALADAPLRHPWFAPGAPPVVIGVGRLAEQKNFQSLIRAFACIRRQRPARLLILGEGPLRGELAALAAALDAAEDVALPGFVGNPYRYMSRASVFVLSSKWECHPLVLAEALACGCPVVSTDCFHGPSEVLRGGIGRIVPPGDEAALAAAIAATLDRPPAREPLVERGMWFSVERAAERYVRLIPGADAPSASDGWSGEAAPAAPVIAAKDVRPGTGS